MGKALFIMALAVPALLAGSAFADDGVEGLGFKSALSGAQEVPAVMSDGRGRAEVRFARDLSAVDVKVMIKDLTGEVRAAHLHCAVAGQNGPVVVGLMPTTGVTEGRIVKAGFDNDDVVERDCLCGVDLAVNNIASLRYAADLGCIYVNVHTTTVPSGEVRGQLLEADDDDDDDND